MALDEFCWLLFALAFGGQLLAVGTWWLATRASAEVKARFRPLSRTSPVVWGTLAVLGIFAGFTWAIAASDAGVFPAAGIENLQLRVVGKVNENVTRGLLMALSMPLLLFFPVMFYQPELDAPPKRRKRRRRRSHVKRDSRPS